MKSTMLLFLAFFCLSAAVVAQAQTAITTCGTIINRQGQYVLANDLLNCPSDGVRITALGTVELNLASHRITGTGGGDGISARLQDAFGSLLFIRGPGTISGFRAGIRTTYLGLADVSGVTCTRNNVGFAFASNTTPNVRNNTASANTGAGFEIASSLSIIETNMATGNGTDGIYISRGQDNQLKNNTALNNNRDGISCSSTERNRITSNTAQGNSAYDLFQEQDTCGSNSWTNNMFNTANLPCIQ